MPDPSSPNEVIPFTPAALVTLLYGRQMVAAYLTYLAGA